MTWLSCIHSKNIFPFFSFMIHRDVVNERYHILRELFFWKHIVGSKECLDIDHPTEVNLQSMIELTSESLDDSNELSRFIKEYETMIDGYIQTTPEEKNKLDT